MIVYDPEFWKALCPLDPSFRCIWAVYMTGLDLILSLAFQDGFCQKNLLCHLIPGIWSARLQTLILYLLAGIFSKAGRTLETITLRGTMSTAHSLRLDTGNLYWFLIQDCFCCSSIYDELLYAGPPSLFIYWVALIHGENNLFHIYKISYLPGSFLHPVCQNATTKGELHFPDSFSLWWQLL